MNKLLLVVKSSLLAAPAYAETVAEKTGINSTLGIAPTTRDFVQEAAISDMFEIQSSQIASTKLNGADKDIPENMIEHHSKTSEELSGQVRNDNTPVPPAMDRSHQQMLDKLIRLNGEG